MTAERRTERLQDTRYLTQVLGNVFGAGAVWNYPATYGASITLRLH